MIRRLVGEGSVDEVHVAVMPELLGGGLWLFECFDLDLDRVRPEAIDAQTAGPRTSLAYRVVR